MTSEGVNDTRAAGIQRVLSYAVLVPNCNLGLSRTKFRLRRNLFLLTTLQLLTGRSRQRAKVLAVTPWLACELAGLTLV